MSGRLWLILFLLTVAIGVTAWMSSAKQADVLPQGETVQNAPLPRPDAPKLEEAEAMPTPHKMGKAPLEVAGSALGANGLPGPSDSVVIPPTATEIAPLPDGFPSAFPGSAPPPSNYPAPAYPPQVYPDSGTTPQDGGTGGGGFEGDIPPPPEAPREWQPEDGAVPPEDTNY